MNKCQVRSRAASHSPEPEMFTVHTPAGVQIQCLAHAVISEKKGLQANIILS